MNDPAPTRIVLGLQPGDAGEDCIHVASRLAMAMQAAIHALVVEEQTLLDAAALPFTRIVARPGQTPPEFSVATVERATTRAERRFRQALSAEAQPMRIPWSMQRERGELAQALSAFAGAADIVMLPDARGGNLNRLVMARVMASRVRGVVIARRENAIAGNGPGPVVVLDEGGPGGESAVALATKLAAGMGRPLHVLVLAGSAREADVIEQRAFELTAPLRGVQLHRLPADRGDAIMARLASLDAALLVASIDTPALASDAALLELQRASGAPLLLMAAPQSP